MSRCITCKCLRNFPFLIEQLPRSSDGVPEEKGSEQVRCDFLSHSHTHPDIMRFRCPVPILTSRKERSRLKPEVAAEALVATACQRSLKPLLSVSW